MGFRVFAITLGNAHNVFFAGQTIRGNVIIVASQPANIDGLNLKLSGYASVMWTEKSKGPAGHANLSQEVTYTNHKEYFTHRISLCEHVELTVGEHRFPFTYALPDNLPSSFEGPYGHIRYIADAHVVREWRTERVKEPFTVNAQIDLNQMPSTWVGLSGENESKVFNFCCSGIINITAHISKSGFVPGEVIRIDGQVSNMSTRRQVRVAAALRQNVTYFANGGSSKRTPPRDVSKFKKQHVLPGHTQIWHGELLAVPSVPPSHQSGIDSIIDIQYDVEISATIEPFGFSPLDINLPVVIGTIPLCNNFSGDPRNIPRQIPRTLPRLPSEADSELSSESAILPVPPRISESYPSIAPPSYAESVFGTDNVSLIDEHAQTMDSLNYVPYYPMYNVRDNLLPSNIRSASTSA